MSNYPNPSYAMCENTLLAMRQVVDSMLDDGASFLMELSSDERRAFKDLFIVCEDFMNLSQDLEDEISDIEQGFDDHNDSMDGDHATALASAGWGTDEDYQ